MKPDPKHKRIKLTPAQWDSLRVSEWGKRGCCCERCHKYLDIKGGLERGPHFHHKKTRGAGGDDTPENLEMLCWHCHMKADS